MKKIIFRCLFVIVAFCLFWDVKAETKSQFKISPGVDLVSSYIWRGVYQTGPAIQPSLALSYAGFSLTAWGSTDFNFASPAKEFDLSLNYTFSGLSLTVTDYWWSGEGARYFKYKDSHFLEGTIGYYGGEKFPLSLTWSTMFGFNSDKKANGDRCFSTYIEAGYDFSVKGVDLTASLGVTPWTGLYHREGTNGFDVSSVSLKASKEIKVTDSFDLPLFVQCIFSPNQDNVYLVVGMSF